MAERYNINNGIYDANTVLKADTDDTPVALTMAASTILARLASGSIKAATVSEILSLLGSPSPQAGGRYSAYLSAAGLISESFPLEFTVVNVEPQTTTAYAHGHYLYAGETITNIVVSCHIAGTSTAPTLMKFALYSSSGTTLTCRAVSADVSSSFTSTGIKVIPMGTPYVVPTSGMYYAVVLQVGGFAGTKVQLGRATPFNVTGVTGAIGSGQIRIGSISGGATNIAVNDTGTIVSGATTTFYTGLS